MSKTIPETWDIANLGWRVNHNVNYNRLWISSNELQESPKSLQALGEEGLDISDSCPHEIGWLRNIDRLIDMMPTNFNPFDYELVDIGCGSGISTLYFSVNYPFASCLGIDFSPSLIQIAQKNHKSLNKDVRACFMVKDARSYKIKLSDKKLFLYLFNSFGFQTAIKFISNNIEALREREAVMAFAWDTWIHQFISVGLHKKIVRNQYYKLSLIFF